MSLMAGMGNALGGVVGGLAGGFTGGAGMQNAFQADPYKVDQNAFTDPNAAANKQSLASAMAERQGMATPTATAAATDLNQLGSFYNQDAANAARGQQQTLAAALAAQANGTGGPSVAELQMQRGMGAAINAQRAQAASARGVSPGLAQRMAANNIAQVQGGVAADSAILRANEAAGARQQLAGVLAGMRGQDTQSAQFQAGQLGQGLMQNTGFQQQTNMANQQAELEAQRQRDQMSQFYTGAGLGVDANSFAAQQEAERQRQAAYNASQGINAGVAAGNTALQGHMVGGLLSAGGTALASDERIKEGVKGGERTSSDFLDAISAKRFRYKGEDVEHLGVMAQDVERAPGGAGMVREVNGTKMIDVPQAVGRLLATSATLHDRLKKLEAKRAAKLARKAV